MKNLNEIKSILSENKDFLNKKFGVSSLGIFGSFVRNEQTDISDIDILVEFDKTPGLEFIDLAEELEKLLDHKVDLVSKNAVKERLMNYIAEELIYV
jgi:predicted nucleotidyltransferase